jgi:chromosome segregation ATPase
VSIPAWLQVVGYLATILASAGLSALLTIRSTNRKTTSEGRKAEQEADRADVEARKMLSEATLQLMQPLVNRAQDLEVRLRTTEQELLQAKRLTEQLTDSLREAQAETLGLRAQVDQMSKELTALHMENERLRHDA